MPGRWRTDRDAAALTPRRAGPAGGTGSIDSRPMEPGERMHRYTDETAWIAAQVETYANDRIALDPPPLDAPRTPAQLAAKVGPTITPQGIGAKEALRLYVEELAPATITTDHPMFLAFVPGAPTKVSILFDLAVSASIDFSFVHTPFGCGLGFGVTALVGELARRDDTHLLFDLHFAYAYSLGR